MDPDPDPFHLVKRTPIFTWLIVGLSLSFIYVCSWVNAGVRPQPKKETHPQEGVFLRKDW